MCGFGTVETMRRAFQRRFEINPAAYRSRFRSRGGSTGPMQIAIPLYDRFTALDAVGPYEVLSRLPDSQLTFVGYEVGPVRTDNETLTMHADAVSRTSRARRDRGARRLGHARAARRRAHPVAGSAHAHEHSEWTTSVCTGSLLLGAAGRARRARGHDALARARDARRLRRVRRPDAASSSRARSITAAGVSSGIDMAPDARREDRGRRVREDDPAPDRVRPRAAVRLGLDADRVRGDDRAGARHDRRPGRGGGVGGCYTAPPCGGASSSRSSRRSSSRRRPRPATKAGAPARRGRRETRRWRWVIRSCSGRWTGSWPRASRWTPAAAGRWPRA